MRALLQHSDMHITSPSWPQSGVDKIANMRAWGEDKKSKTGDSRRGSWLRGAGGRVLRCGCMREVPKCAYWDVGGRRIFEEMESERARGVLVGILRLPRFGSCIVKILFKKWE